MLEFCTPVCKSQFPWRHFILPYKLWYKQLAEFIIFLLVEFCTPVCKSQFP